MPPSSKGKESKKPKLKRQYQKNDVPNIEHTMSELDESGMQLEQNNLPPPIYLNTSASVSTDNRGETHQQQQVHEDSGTSEGAIDHLDQTVVTHNQ